MSKPTPHDLTQSGHQQRRSSSNKPCVWCRDNRRARPVFCSSQCRHEHNLAVARGWLPGPGAVDERGKVEFFVVFWQQLREALVAHDHAALAFIAGPQFPAWCHLSGLDDYETVRWGLYRAWDVHFGEHPLFTHTPCPRCGRADPADFWDNRKYCKHCEGSWKAGQKARRATDD